MSKVPSRKDVVDSVRAMLASLDYGLDERWAEETASRHDMMDGTVRDGDADLCRIQFSCDPYGGWSLRVLPSDPSSEKTIVRAGERQELPERCWTLEELDHVESLFRALRVREGRLAQLDFASDYALRQWVAKASTMRLPHERNPRRPRTEDVVIRPGEAPASMHPCSTAVSQGIVKALRLLDGDGYERERALDVAYASARQDDGGPDAGLAWLARTARIMLRGRRRDMDLAWDAASFDRVITGQAGPRDDFRVPMAEDAGRPVPEPSEPDAPAPRM